jgi:predicted metal-dependent peptidase
VRIQDAMIQLLLKQPFYGYIAASITTVESIDIPTTKMLTAPALSILYNKEWYESLSTEHALGVVIHELLHLIFMHSFRKGNRESLLWIIACDMAVNEYIDSSLLFSEAITVDKIAEEIKEKIPKNKGAELYYDIISRNDNSLSFMQKDKEIRIALKDGRQLKANSTAEIDCSEINRNAFKGMFSEIMAQAQSEGETPEGISGIIEEIYNSDEINWRNVLKRFLTGKGKMITRKTYKRESKRYEGLPGNKRIIGMKALLAIDESGSISSSQTSKFFKEVLNIKRITNADLSVSEFDNNCTEPIPIERFIKQGKRTKNGGTDFRPIFKVADSMRFPVVIIFTDGEGIAPSSCSQNVLWILTKGGKRPAEFGYYLEYKA